MTITLSAVLALVASCSRRPPREATDKTAAAIQAELAGVRELTDNLVSQIEDVYAHLERYDLSTEHLDVDKGGKFSTFKGNAYYVSGDRAGLAYYISPGAPPDETLRREVKIFTHLEPAVLATWNRLPIGEVVFFGVAQPYSVCGMAPYFDVPSFFPPGLTLGAFEWYQRGAKSPERAQWSKQPFTDLASKWIMDISRGVKAAGAVKGAVVISISLGKLGRKYFRSQGEKLLLLSADAAVVSASPSALAELQLPVLEDPDSLRQTGENKLPSKDLRLSDPSQESGVRAFAARVVGGETAFQETIHGKTYRVVARAVPEVGFHVVGVAP